MEKIEEYVKDLIQKAEQGDKNFNCELCEKSFVNNAGLKAHVTYVHEGIKYECDVCQKIFQNPLYLKRHVKNSHDIKDFNRCKQYLKETIPRKKRELKEKNKKIYTCEICSKTFPYRALLSKHVKNVHEGVKEYQCDTCGKEFKSKGGLETHQLLHDTQRENYKCEICGKNFVTKVGHAQHIVNVHEDSKKYPCDVCGQSFIPRDLCIKIWKNGNIFALHILLVIFLKVVLSPLCVV